MCLHLQQTKHFDFVWLVNQSSHADVVFGVPWLSYKIDVQSLFKFGQLAMPWDGQLPSRYV